MPHGIIPHIDVWVSAWAWLLGRHYCAYVHRPALTCRRSSQRSSYLHSSCKPILQQHMLLHLEDDQTYSLRWPYLVNDVWMVLILMTNPYFYFLLLQNRLLQSELWQLGLLQQHLLAISCLELLRSAFELHLEVQFRFASFQYVVDIHSPSFQSSKDALLHNLPLHMVLACCPKRTHYSY